MKRLIGVTADVLPVRHRRKYTAYHTYVEALRAAGALAVVLPPDDPDRAVEVLDALDGLLLPGGDDLHPRHWGEEEVHPAAVLSAEERSLYEIALVRTAVERELPLLGICLGCQTLNVALGGTVEQHLDPALGHGAGEGGSAESNVHEVFLEEGSRLRQVAGSPRARVNSGHHQAVGRLGRALRVAARAPDGTIEAIEGTGASFLLGVQWHPEERASDPLSRAIFRQFGPR